MGNYPPGFWWSGWDDPNYWADRLDRLNFQSWQEGAKTEGEIRPEPDFMDLPISADSAAYLQRWFEL